MAADRPLSKHSAPPIGRKRMHIEPSLSLSLREEGSWKVIRREDREYRKEGGVMKGVIMEREEEHGKGLLLGVSELSL